MTPSGIGLGFAARLSALYAALFVLSGVQLPFFPVWLKAKGLDAATIGLVLAVPMVVRVAAIPFATRAADRRDALRATIVLACAFSVAGFALLGFADSVPAIFAAYALASLAFTPIMPLTDAYALKGLAARGRAYGPVRLWGSASFILGTFAAGFAADAFAPRHLIWLIVGAAVLMAVAALTLAPLAGGAAPAEQAPPRRLLGDRTFLAVVAAASLIQASHAVYYGFSALAWRAQGLDGAAIAALWALGVIAEIVLFAVQARLPPFFTPLRLLTIGALGGALRWTAMAFDPPAAALPALQILHAATFGASHLGALIFIARHAPPGQAATAQGYYAIAGGLAMAGAIALSGSLYAGFGLRAYGAMALMAVAGGACAVVTSRIGAVAVR
jgi:MFS transporter, PPP family, 3-phenylpropionic acid transporter